MKVVQRELSRKVQPGVGSEALSGGCRFSIGRPGKDSASRTGKILREFTGCKDSPARQ